MMVMLHLYKLNEQMYIRMKTNFNIILHSSANKTCAHLYICMHVSKTKTCIVMKHGYEIAYILRTAEWLHLLFSSSGAYFPTKYTEKIRYPTLFVLQVQFLKNKMTLYFKSAQS